MTTPDALLEIAKTLHHLANTIELSVVAPGTELIPTNDDPPVKEDKTSMVDKNHSITLQQIKGILQQKASQGLRAEVNRLLLAFGVTNLNDVPEDKYPELLLAAEEL